MLDPEITPQPLLILLIDDDEISRELTATLLGMSGYAVQCAASGEEAVQLLSASVETIPFILLDAQMPGLSGLPLISALRGLSAAHICLISASEPPSALRAEADLFLRKPFAPTDLDKLLKTDGTTKYQGISSFLIPETGPGTAVVPHIIAQVLDEPALVVDLETLTQLRQIMPEAALREIFTALVGDLHKRVQSLENALAQGDAAELRRLGHSIKGGCSMVGAIQASRLGARIESGALDFSPVLASNPKLDHNANVLIDLRLAIGNLERMLLEGLPL